MKVYKEVFIDDLVTHIPKSIQYLSNKGIRCIRCGEPIWGTLEAAAKEKGLSKNEIEQIVVEINRMQSNMI